MTRQELIDRLSAAHPGWKVYDELIRLVQSLQFRSLEIEHFGEFIASGSRLVFSASAAHVQWPAWLPNYVPALYGLKADDCEMEGGYAARFSNEPAKKGAVFSRAGNDQDLGFPLIDVPDGTFDFQGNASGAGFFVNTRQQVVYPNSEAERFEVLDSLDKFTQVNIRQALERERWFTPYAESIKGTLVD